MADEEEVEEEGTKKKSKMPLIIGLVLALVGGGGGFFAVQSGMLFGDQEEHAAETDSHEEVAEMPNVVFVPMDPVIINLGKGSHNQYLRFRGELEVGGEFEADVSALLPRVMDVLNGYLRAVDVHELENPNSLIRLRSQMLRRIQIVTGEGRVKDLLIMEFVLN